MTSPFTLFGLQPALLPDETLLRKKYLQLQRDWHPDFVAADPQKHAEALRMTSEINEAHLKLQTLEGRIAALCEMHEMAGLASQALPQTFLMEMMDLNELVQEAVMADDATARNAATEQLQALVAENRTNMSELARCADEKAAATGSYSPESLKELMVLVQKQKYFRRLEMNLHGEQEI